MWKISLLIVLIVFPVPVLVFESEEDLSLFLLLGDIPIEITQIHSLSHSPILERFTATRKGFYHDETIFDDQGGAGMPNHSQVIKNNEFEVRQNRLLQDPIYMVLTPENDIKISGVRYNMIGHYCLETRYTSFINFLFRLGVYENKVDII